MAQLKGTATKFIEQYNWFTGRNETPIMPIQQLQSELSFNKKHGVETIAVWHITPHPLIDLEKLKIP